MNKCAVSAEATNVVQKVKRGELSALQANRKLLDLLQMSETVDDLQFAYTARADLEKLAADALLMR